MALTDYEILQHTDVLAIHQHSWKGHSLLANFGDGYGAGINSGNVSGIRRWTLSAGALPDLDEYSVTYYLSGSQTDTRFDYLFEFVKRHVTTNNKPFYLADYHLTDPLNWLVSFELPSIDFEVLAAQLFAGAGVTLVQRRVSDLSFNSDGSVDTSAMVPANFTANGVSMGVQLDWDANANADGYEVNIVRTNEIVDVGTAETYTETGLSSGTFYEYRVRSYNDEGLRGVWSAVASDPPA